MSCNIVPGTSWTIARRCNLKQRQIIYRLYHHSSSPLDRSRKAFISKCVEDLHQQSHDPVWRLIGALNPRTPTLVLTSALHNASISLSEYQSWKQCLYQPSIEQAVQSIRDKAPPALRNSQDVYLPKWLVLYLLAKRPGAYTDVAGAMMDLLSLQIPRFPLHLKPPLLIFAATHLASWNLLVPLQGVVDEFLNLPHPVLTPVLPMPNGTTSTKCISPSDPVPVPQPLTIDSNPSYDLYFNLFLRALAHIPKHSTAYATYVTSTISRMAQVGNSTLSDTKSALDSLTEPRFKIHPDTYTALLLSTPNSMNPKGMIQQAQILSPQLASFLRSQMKAENLTPWPEHLEAFLRFWGKEAVGNGARSGKRALKGKDMSDRFWKDLQKSVTQRNTVDDASDYSSGELNPAIRGNTLYLGAQGRVKDLNAAVKKLNDGPKAQDGQGKPQTPRSPLIHKANPDIYDVSAALHSAANDRSTPTNTFIKLFNRLSTSRIHSSSPVRLQPTIVTHTIRLRGLMHRREFEKAEEYWKFVVDKSGLELDKMALTAGLQILTRCERPHEAFKILEQYAWKPTSSSLPSQSPTYSLNKPIRLSSISVNEWMVSLKRIARPDVVFKLWDHMYTLYGVLHTNATFDIMLQSARMAVIIDGRSVGTQISNYFKIQRNKLTSRTEKTGFATGHDPRARREASQEIVSILGHPNQGGLKPYHGGLWRGKRPEDTAREIFLQVLFGMDLGSGQGMSLALSSTSASGLPRKALADVQAPARAVREGWDSDGGIVGLGVGLPSIKMRKFQYQPGPELYQWTKGYSYSQPQPPSGSYSKVTDPQNDTPLEPRPHYPHLILNNANFLNYLSLLAVTSKTTEVALTMAWMRELGIQPSESTLALAMVLWGEVSAESPFVERLVRSSKGRLASTRRGGNGAGEGGEGMLDGRENQNPQDEFERFVLWLEDWVGPGRIPGDGVLRKWRMIVRGMREADMRPRRDLDESS